MNYPRVNLLKKSEQRYQGAVSRRFMFVSIVVTPVLLIAILSGIKLIQYGGVQANLKSSREIWADLEPQLDRFRNQQRGLSANQQAIDLIQGWKSSQVSMEGVLLDIQQAIPEKIQLTRISVRSKITTSVYNNPDELELGYRLVLQGVSQGSQAEGLVISLRKNLLKKDHLSTIFDSVKLISMSKREGSAGESMREFSFEGFNSQGETEE